MFTEKLQPQTNAILVPIMTQITYFYKRNEYCVRTF